MLLKQNASFMEISTSYPATDKAHLGLELVPEAQQLGVAEVD